VRVCRTALTGVPSVQGVRSVEKGLIRWEQGAAVPDRGGRNGLNGLQVEAALKGLLPRHF
jgi:hypothetical protein